MAATLSGTVLICNQMRVGGGGDDGDGDGFF